MLAGRLILRRECGDVACEANLVEARRDIQVAAQANFFGDAREKALDRVGADRREHFRHVFGSIGNEHNSALKRKRPPRRTPEAERNLSSRTALTDESRAGATRSPETPPPNPLPEAERGTGKPLGLVPPLRFGKGVRGWGGSGPNASPHLTASRNPRNSSDAPSMPPAQV